LGPQHNKTAHTIIFNYCSGFKQPVCTLQNHI